MWAIGNGTIDTFMVLLSAGADPNTKTEPGWMPLSFAINRGNVEIINSLLTAGAKPNRDDKVLREAIYGARRRRNCEVAREIPCLISLQPSKKDTRGSFYDIDDALAFAPVRSWTWTELTASFAFTVAQVLIQLNGTSESSLFQGCFSTAVHEGGHFAVSAVEEEPPGLTNSKIYVLVRRIARFDARGDMPRLEPSPRSMWNSIICGGQ